MKIPRPPTPGRVLGLYTLPNANAYYRLIVPLRTLPSASWAQIDRVEPAQLEAADIVIMQALGGRIRDVRSAIRSLRKEWGITRILVDYDDAMFEPHPYAPVRMRKYQLDSVREAICLADGVIVTSEYLARHVEQHTGKPAAIVPNLVWPDDWPESPPSDHPPTVVLAGSPSHHYDWNLVVPALEWLRKNAPDVRLRLLGCPHPLIKQIATEGGGGWRTPADYVESLAGGTIGLCPLPDTAFNRGKSPIKAFEYSLAAGMAVIGSPTQYAPILEHGRGLVVRDHDPLGWVKCLAFYLADPARRQADAARLRAHILDTFDARRFASQIATAYTQEIRYATH